MALEMVQICLLVVGYPITMMRSKIRMDPRQSGKSDPDHIDADPNPDQKYVVSW